MDNVDFEFPQGNDVLMKLQAVEFEIAVTIKAIFERHNIRYVIEYGTLLGAVRHGGFIPWDDDFDFVVLEEDYEKASEVLRQELPSKFVLHDGVSDPAYFYSFSKVRHLYSSAIEDGFTDQLKYKGISADLFKGRIERNNKYARQLFLASNHTKSHWKKLKRDRRVTEIGKTIGYALLTCYYKFMHMVTPKEMYFHKSPVTDQYFIPLDQYMPFSTVSFNGVDFPAPHNPDYVLRDRFGDWTKIPDTITFHIKHVDFYPES